jgi:hypothetical protein
VGCRRRRAPGARPRPAGSPARARALRAAPASLGLRVAEPAPRPPLRPPRVLKPHGWERSPDLKRLTPDTLIRWAPQKRGAARTARSARLVPHARAARWRPPPAPRPPLTHPNPLPSVQPLPPRKI